MKALRVIAGIASVLLVLSGCGGDEGVQGGDTPTTQSPLAPAGLGSGSDYSVLGALSEIPAAGVDSGASGVLMIQTGDLEEATELEGGTRPTGFDTSALGQWLGPLTGVPGSGEQPKVFVPVAESLGLQRLAQIEEFDSELGWSILDVDAFLEVSTPPHRFSVVTGDIDGLSPDLMEVSDAVVKAGTGDEFEFNAGETSAARPLGAPLFLSQRESTVALGATLAPVEQWVSGGSKTLADDSGLAGVAGALDGEDVVSAILLKTDATWSDQVARSADPTDSDATALADDLTASLDGEESTATLGIGWGVNGEDLPQVTLAYNLNDGAAARAAVPLLRHQYEELFAQSGPTFEVADVRAEGTVAVVVLSPEGDTQVASIWARLNQMDLPLFG